MSVRGIEFHTEESPQAIIKYADGSLSLKTNRGTVDGFSHIMFATGRRPNTKVWSLSRTSQSDVCERASSGLWDSMLRNAIQGMV